MGLDVTSLLVVGIYCTRVKKGSTRTKYNQDTGEPYLETYTYFQPIIESTGESLNPNTPDDLSIYQTYLESASVPFVYGLPLVQTKSNRSSEQSIIDCIDLSDLSALLEKVERLLVKQGIEVKPKVYVVQEHSY